MTKLQQTQTRWSQVQGHEQWFCKCSTKCAQDKDAKQGLFGLCKNKINSFYDAMAPANEGVDTSVFAEHVSHMPSHVDPHTLSWTCVLSILDAIIS